MPKTREKYIYIHVIYIIGNLWDTNSQTRHQKQNPTTLFHIID